MQSGQILSVTNQSERDTLYTENKKVFAFPFLRSNMNASIRNQSQSFLSSMFQPSITRLSDDRIELIKEIFPTFSSFFAFCKDNVDITDGEIDDLINEIYPKDYSQIDDYSCDPLAWWQKETAWNHIDSDGDLAWKDMSILYTS